MHRLSAPLLILIGLLASFDAAACHRISPDAKALNSYSAIFLGVVTGIHLDGYENRLLGKPDGFIDGEGITITDGSSPVSVTAVSINSVRGSSNNVVTLRLVGCTTALPALREQGLFFVNSDGKSAVTVWQSNSSEFTDMLKQLGVQPDGR